VTAELHGKIAREVLDGRYVGEGLSETLLQEPLETVALKRDKIGYVENLWDLGERASLAKTSLDKMGSGSTGHQAIPPPVVGLST
jgi:hypothetical protein